MTRQPSAMNKDKHLSESEIALLRAKLSSIRASEPIKYLAITLLLESGMRVSELLLVKRKDIDLDTGSLYITATKDSNDRCLPLSPQVVEALKDQYATLTPESKLFPVTVRCIQKWWVQLKPVNKKLHCLRHTFAIQLYKTRKDTQLVKSALGHKSIANTMVYAEYIYQVEELRDSLRSMFEPIKQGVK